ncbi:GIY-YIG nuclease family protein [Pedobacter fastidiosus]|uniref:GIY-YIG nuclease family protein n=1 Tax=Pedobacter fastidiosus TaxID=2765361 RepID=A0ABR7KUG6_9SPHI|nr:GIY-YIG nuclease family protein [Pedobacter fastidiosus]MBC6111470.1 GIY-YIG nuclease family protein [Pedobacter fastidiosus]
MERGGCVYIMTNSFNTIFYTGVTSELESRIWQHKNNEYPKSFTSKYKCFKLVYFMFFPTIEDAIAEEKRIKGGNRQQKIDLIIRLNPSWKDLYDELN